MERRATILIVEDEQISLRVLSKILEPESYNVLVARDGEEALRLVREHSVDLILLDVMIPKVSGYDVCRAIKSNIKTMVIPIVMVTSLEKKEDKLKGIEAGADDFLTKPVDMLELRIRVQNLLKMKGYHEQLLTYNERLEREVQERTRELKLALNELYLVSETVKKSALETIYRLSVSVEYRDGNTGSHIQRMSRSAEAVAKKMGLSKDLVETILYASPMHDIGKVGIPDRILLKPGKLSDEEWVIMRSHTTIGASILANSDSELIRMAERIALTHHERFDGSGYPNGLKGMNIPIEGRITSVVDVFDALMSVRPYKAAFTAEESREIIETSSGSHFDPEVTEAFFSVFDEVLEITQRHEDPVAATV